METIMASMKSSGVDPGVGNLSKVQNEDSRAADAAYRSNTNGQVAKNAENNAKPVSGQMDDQQAKEALEALHETLNALQTTLNFSVNEDSDQMVVLVKNKETDEIIRQIPPKELLALRDKMEELTGILFDKIA